MLRLFVGIGLPPDLKLRISLLCTGVPEARWVDAGNFHLTLRFIGEVDEGVASDIDAALLRLAAPRFSLALAGVGPYTARAVLAFAFERDVGVVDTNAARVLARAGAGRALGAAEVQRLLARAREWVERLGLPVRCWLSDKQDAFVTGIAATVRSALFLTCSWIICRTSIL